MGELRSVPELLVRSDRSFARTQHRLHPIKFWILGIVGCLYVGALVFFAIFLVFVWQAGEWLAYWAGFIVVGSIGIRLARIASWRDSRANLFAPVAELRQAIRDGDETLAPVAEMSQTPSSDVTTDRGRLGPLQRPAATGTVATLWGIAVLVLLVLCVGVPFALAAGNGHLVLLLAAVGLPLGLICILLGLRFICPLFVCIDLDGLRWRRPFGLMAFVAWRDAKSFFSLTYAGSFLNDREMLYVLDCGRMRFAWRASADTKSVASPHSPSLKLQHLITAYTGLPLRDVTAQAKHIAQALEGEAPQTSHGARMPAGTSRLPKEEVKRRMRLLRVILSPFVILALVALVAMLVQAPYYGHLYAQAHSHVAFYRDALTHADGDWPDNAFSHFEQGTYHFQQSETQNYLTYVMAPVRYDRALVEVSGRTGGRFNLGGVGLAISGPSRSTPLLTFRVAPDGSWWIERRSRMEIYEAHNFVRIGHMGAIHQGFGVSNQIAVLLNGADFIFYVNGQYATGYHDDALKGGAVCLYLDVTSDSGDFSNFAVYPM